MPNFKGVTKVKKTQTPMEKLTQGYEKFIKGKKTNPSGKSDFNKGLKKAAKPKQRGSKQH
jgi:hypothetical protein